MIIITGKRGRFNFKLVSRGIFLRSPEVPTSIFYRITFILFAPCFFVLCFRLIFYLRKVAAFTVDVDRDMFLELPDVGPPFVSAAAVGAHYRSEPVTSLRALPCRQFVGGRVRPGMGQCQGTARWHRYVCVHSEKPLYFSKPT